MISSGKKRRHRDRERTEKMQMNLPNKLTILRVLMIPLFVALMYASFPGNFIAALAVYVLACLTDLLDGKIARKYNLVTNFGKFMDPLADKLLVSAALICLVDLKRIPAWVVIIIISREFIISGFRLVAADKGTVIAASYWGKFKTVFQMAMTILMIINLPFGWAKTLTMAVMWIAVILTVVSLADYVIRNRKVLGEED